MEKLIFQEHPVKIRESYVSANCTKTGPGEGFYTYIDFEAGEVGVYDKTGKLIKQRAATKADGFIVKD